jgi:hypothetical protein
MYKRVQKTSDPGRPAIARQIRINRIQQRINMEKEALPGNPTRRLKIRMPIKKDLAKMNNKKVNIMETVIKNEAGIYARAENRLTVKGWGASGALIGGEELKPMDIERNPPGMDEVLIEVLYCGVCHSDIHQVANDWKNTIYPAYLVTKSSAKWLRLALL